MIIGEHLWEDFMGVPVAQVNTEHYNKMNSEQLYSVYFLFNIATEFSHRLTSGK